MNEPAQAALPPRKGRRRPTRFFRPLFLTIAAAFVIILIWCGMLYYRIVSFEGVTAADGVHADAGIVLGASLWHDKPSPGLRERLDHALVLYRAGVFPRIIVTGGLDAAAAKLTEAEGMRDYLLEQGVPPDAIALDTKSTSTYENLLFAHQIMQENGWRTAVIVTHRYHGARAADIAGTVGFEHALVSVTDSKVMMMAYHEAREVLAFTKWKVDKLVRSLG